MRTIVRAVIRPGKREELPGLIQASSFPADLRKVIAKGTLEGDICYFTFGGLLGAPWEKHRAWVEQNFEVEYATPEAEMDKDELKRVQRLQGTGRKFGFPTAH
ncbi:MAG: hypothetical protein LC624_04675 [Halobacteriales archaeon]|nr:hypothetical protein [Halobacteriales archaeon]